jgi:hypothetical protein
VSSGRTTNFWRTADLWRTWNGTNVRETGFPTGLPAQSESATQTQEGFVDDDMQSACPRGTATDETDFQWTLGVIEALRARALLFLHRGAEPLKVASTTGCARAAARRTVYRFGDLGDDGLLSRRGHWPPSKVTVGMEVKLVGCVDHSPPDFGGWQTTRTLDLLPIQLVQDPGVRLSPIHVRNSLLANDVRRELPRVGLRIPVRGPRRIVCRIDRLVPSAALVTRSYTPTKRTSNSVRGSGPRI